MDEEMEVESKVVENRLVDACRVHDRVDLTIIHSICQCLPCVSKQDFRCLIQCRHRDSVAPLEENTFLRFFVNKEKLFLDIFCSELWGLIISYDKIKIFVIINCC
jgi:hypothetical protein